MCCPGAPTPGAGRAQATMGLSGLRPGKPPPSGDGLWLPEAGPGGWGRRRGREEGGEPLRESSTEKKGSRAGRGEGAGDKGVGR